MGYVAAAVQLEGLLERWYSTTLEFQLCCAYSDAGDSHSTRRGAVSPRVRRSTHPTIPHSRKPTLDPLSHAR
jgi:hypothetical protein